jgi:hypothetical protein
MKFSFKKIASVAASAAMLASTVGFAAAAALSPFDNNTAVVYGENAAEVDMANAINLQNHLAGEPAEDSGETTVSGDSVKFEKSSTKFHLGDTITAVFPNTLDDDDMPNLLAEGEYTDDDNDEFEYKQQIEMEALQLVMFEDAKYIRDEPSIGIVIDNNADILTYTLDFSDQPLWADLETTDMPLMGKMYYVLEASDANQELTLLDSAVDTTLSEGESKTLSVDGTSYSVEIAFIGGDDVKLEVNGEVTNALQAGETYKLSDDSYVGIKEILTQDYAGGQKTVEFSIGAGKLKLDSGNEVELNDETVDGVTVTITGDTNLEQIDIAWAADGKSFVTETSELVMPGFETLKLAFTGLEYPEEEHTLVDPDGDDTIQLTVELEDTDAVIPILFSNTTDWVAVGDDEDLVVGTADDDGPLTYVEDEMDYFIVSYTDGGDTATSHLVRISKWDDDDSVDVADHKVDLQHMVNGNWVALASNVETGETFDVGDATVTLAEANATTDNETAIFTGTADEVMFDILYTKEGLQIDLPIPGDLGAGTTEFDLVVTEEDEDDQIGGGETFTVVLAITDAGETTVEVGVSDIENEDVGFEEMDDTDVYRSFMYGALATELLWDKSDAGAESLDIVYHGAEVAAGVYLTSAEVVVTPGSVGTGGQVDLMKDSEVTEGLDKHLVVVGGSCVNTVAAQILGSDAPLCAADFTAATQVGPGGYLIKVVESPVNADRRAMLVAGYNAPDTTNAVNRVMSTADPVDTEVGTMLTYPQVA